jgi:UDP-N-acetylmuramate dehydrogenase
MPPVQTEVTLAPYTTLGVGGMAEYFVTVRTDSELRAVLQWAYAHNMPCVPLGGGSNVLVADTGIAGLVVHVQYSGRRQYAIDHATTCIEVGAGVELDTLVADTVAAGWWGLENFSHIPGSVGATPIQNVGAYGVEAADRIEYVRIYDAATDTFVRWDPEDCAFGYRTSFFAQATSGRYFVTHVAFRVTRSRAPVLHYGALRELDAGTVTPTTIREEVIKIRANKFPDWHTVGTAGSFFVNPIVSSSYASELCARYPGLPVYEMSEDRCKVSLGWILDHVCGLRGYQIGTIGLYTKQALVLVHHGGGSATEIHDFARAVAARVYQATGLTIAPEVTMWPQHPRTGFARV